MQAMLALEDGRVFKGKSFGARVERAGEVVFNTSLTGVPGDLYGPELCGSDCGADEPAYWELWDLAERCGECAADDRRVGDAGIFTGELELAVDRSCRRIP